MPENNKNAAVDAVISEAKKKIAAAAEEVFNIMMAEKLSRLADDAAAKLAAIKEISDVLGVDALSLDKANVMKSVIEETVEETLGVVEDTSEPVVDKAVVAAVIAEAVEESVQTAPVEEEAEEEVTAAVDNGTVITDAVADAPVVYSDDDPEPYVVHFEDEDDEYDENGERIPYLPYN